ncbi:MAG: type II/IV secretion system protein [Planctomycetaceae bacterium]|nr:type II/IV secretion system protein [Planctomycetaceae bacterium]
MDPSEINKSSQSESEDEGTAETQDASTSQISLEAPQASIEELPPEARQRALQEELTSLIDVVGPGPLVDLLLERAFELGGTDVHFDPHPKGLQVRLRLDGVLHDIVNLTPQYAPQIVSRIKLMAGMNITERRFSQDGHIANSALLRHRDVRVGSGPTIYGERVVMRLMPDSTKFTKLEELGMTERQIQIVNEAVHAPFGAILCVGPVGCGKSTTTYACLQMLNNPERSLVTIEDPVERRIDRVNQIQVDAKNGFGFVQALRGVLRQDPDVIMVGEIRDAETAHIAIRAGLTGTRVLSTLHAGDTGATIDMFREFQIPRMFLADAIKCVIAQRLLRKVCEKDQEMVSVTPAAARILGLTPDEAATKKIARGIPTDANFHTGYSGRSGVFEVMSITESVRELLMQGKSGRTVYEQARSDGMLTLEDSAREMVLKGVTSVEEMTRVLI